MFIYTQKKTYVLTALKPPMIVKRRITHAERCKWAQTDKGMPSRRAPMAQTSGEEANVRLPAPLRRNDPTIGTGRKDQAVGAFCFIIQFC